MNTRLILLGVSGLDWPSFQAALAAGRLPALASLAAGAGAAPLACDIPLNGPAAWATIATGFAPHAHGLVHPFESWAGGVRPVGHATWRAEPIWARLERAGIATAGVGSPGLRPGAAWSGAHVDDRIAEPDGFGWDNGGRAIQHAARRRARRRRASALAAVHGLADWHAILAAAPKGEDTDRPPALWALLDGAAGAIAAARPAGARLLIVSPGTPGRAGVLIADTAPVPGVAPRLVDVAPTALAVLGHGDPTLPGRPVLPLSGPLRALPARMPRPTPDEPSEADLARVAAFGHAPPAPPPGWPAPLLTAEAELSLSRDVARAASLADQALTHAPDWPVALAIAAMARFALGDGEALAPIAAALAARAPDSRWAAMAKAGVHVLAGDARAAAPLLRRAEDGADADELLRIGGAWLLLRRTVDAQRVFAAVLRDRLNQVQALLGLASCVERPLDPAHADARAGLVTMLRHQGRAAEADHLAGGSVASTG